LKAAFAVKFVVSHPLRPEQRVELEGLVDITPSGNRAVSYADGTGAVVPVAKADISIHGIETATMILCGATTLETLGFGVDPIHKTLIPIDAPMAVASAGALC